MMNMVKRKVQPWYSLVVVAVVWYGMVVVSGGGGAWRVGLECFFHVCHYYLSCSGNALCETPFDTGVSEVRERCQRCLGGNLGVSLKKIDSNILCEVLIY